MVQLLIEHFFSEICYHDNSPLSKQIYRQTKQRNKQTAKIIGTNKQTINKQANKQTKPNLMLPIVH